MQRTKLRKDGRKFRAIKKTSAREAGKAAGDKVAISSGINHNDQKRIG